MKNVLCLLVAMLATLSGVAQEGPTLVAELENGKKKPLKIEKLDIQTSISGNIATTQLEFTYRNPLNRLLKAEFKMPLADGQEVFSYALDIEGEMREASVVDRSRARKAFEEIVRRQVDPALLEVEKGNQYKLSIYPILPLGTRTISLSIEEELPIEGAEGIYRLPLKFDQKIDDFTMKVEFLDPAQSKYSSSTLPVSGNLNTAKNRIVAEWNGEDLKFNEPFEMRVPVSVLEEIETFIEKDPKSGANYFYTRIQNNPTDSNSQEIKRIAIFWDRSNSGEHRNLAKELELLDRYISELGDVTIEFSSFALGQSELDSYPVKNGDWSKLREIIQRTRYDGATRFDLPFLKFSKADQILIFSDGITTLGKDESLKSEIPLFAINTSSKAEHKFLRHLSESNGGSYVNLLTSDIDKALNSLSQRPVRIISVSDSNQVDRVAFGSDTNNPNTFWITGELVGGKAQFEVAIGRSNSDSQSYSVELDLSKAKQNDGYVRRKWARSKTEKWIRDPYHDKGAVTAFAQRNKIVSKYTSLIVLDTIEDYVQYRIEPPAHLRNQYYAMLGDEPDPAKGAKDKLERVVVQFEELKQWYERDFPKTKPKRERVSEKEERNGRAMRFSDGNAAMAAPPPSPGMPELRTEGIEPQGASGNVPRERYLRLAEASAAAGESASNEDVIELDSFSAQAASLPQASQNPDLESKVSISSWSPKNKYYEKLSKAPGRDLFALYYKLKKQHGITAGFYFDAASVFREKEMPDVATRILTNVAELGEGDPLLLRALGRRLLQVDEPYLALLALEETKDLRDFEPQSFHDLGLAYAALGKEQKAIETLYHVVEKEFGATSRDIESIVLLDMNRIIANAKQKLDTSFIDERLLYPMKFDIRIVLSWNTNDSDMDLWVTDPYEEKCFYSHNRTHIGGRMSRDITQGFGPEEFLIREAISGKFKIEVNYYGDREQGQKMPTVLSLSLTRNFGRENEETQTTTIRLSNAKEVVQVGEFEFRATDS